MGNEYNIAFNTAEAFKEIGLPMMQKDKAARLLAYVQQFSDEQVVLNGRFLAATAMAAGTFGLKGGNIPDVEGVRLIQHYISTTMAKVQDNPSYPKLVKPIWAHDLEIEYELRPTIAAELSTRDKFRIAMEGREIKPPKPVKRNVNPKVTLRKKKRKKKR